MYELMEQSFSPHETLFLAVLERKKTKHAAPTYVNYRRRSIKTSCVTEDFNYQWIRITFGLALFVYSLSAGNVLFITTDIKTQGH